MFHFTKDEGALGRYVLERLAADPKLIERKNIGVDIESAIYQAFQNFIPPIVYETLKTEGRKKAGQVTE